ncbi:hypothetical protein H1R20_g291, partial [Candolleomyces eurysporus]
MVPQEFAIGHNAPPSSPMEVLEAHVAVEASMGPPVPPATPHFHPRTKVAVQDGLVNWISDGHKDIRPISIVWVVGPAGAGKTAILSSIAQDCRQRNLLAASFFPSLSATTSTESSLIPTLAYQLIQHPNLSRLRGHILSAVEKFPTVFDGTAETQLNSLILTPLHQEVQSDHSAWPKVIIIDGLDEYGSESHCGDITKRRDKDDARGEILKAILTAVADPSFPFRIVLASRPEPAVHAFFEGPAKRFTATLALNNFHSIEADLALFLETKFAQIRPIRYIEESLLPRKALESVIGSVPISVHGPFSPLDALYATILQSSSNPPRTATWLSLIRSMNNGRYCLGQERSFPAFFLKRFLESAPGEGDELLGNVRSLVQIPPSDDKKTPYTFYDKTLFEFLENNERSGPLHISFVDRHKVYTAKYLDVCTNKGFRNAPPAEQDELLDYFVDLDPFFQGGLLYSEDTHLLCDVEWWVHLFIAKLRPAKIRKAFIWAHQELLFDLSVVERRYTPMLRLRRMGRSLEFLATQGSTSSLDRAS